MKGRGIQVASHIIEKAGPEGPAFISPTALILAPLEEKTAGFNRAEDVKRFLYPRNQKPIVC